MKQPLEKYIVRGIDSHFHTNLPRTPNAPVESRAQNKNGYIKFQIAAPALKGTARPHM